jgi:hypothetical protein
MFFLLFAYGQYNIHKPPLERIKAIIISLSLNLDTPAEMQDLVRAAARARRIALGLTQSDLAARSGVPLATLKLFEQKGQISLAGLLAIADALDATAGFGALFPAIEATRLEDLDRPAARHRARTRRSS